MTGRKVIEGAQRDRCEELWRVFGANLPWTPERANA